jgi:hypothetical protein
LDSLDLEDVSIPVTIGVAIIVGEPLISESSESAEPEALTSGKMNPANANKPLCQYEAINASQFT